MTTTLTTSKGTFLFVGVPFKITIAYKGEEESEDELYIHGNKDQMEKHIVDPLSEIVAQLSTLTEEQAREVFKYDDDALSSIHWIMDHYKLYVGEKEQRGFGGQDSESMNDFQDRQSRTFPDWLIIKVK